MWTRTLLKDNAKQALKGRYWRSFWICLALSIAGLGGAGASSGSAARQAVDTTTGETSSVYDILSGIPDRSSSVASGLPHLRLSRIDPENNRFFCSTIPTASRRAARS